MCSWLTYHLCQCIQLLVLWFYSHLTALKIPEDEAFSVLLISSFLSFLSLFCISSFFLVVEFSFLLSLSFCISSSHCLSCGSILLSSFLSFPRLSFSFLWWNYLFFFLIVFSFCTNKTSHSHWVS